MKAKPKRARSKRRAPAAAPGGDRRAARSAETRDRIYAVALDSFRTRGFDDTTMRDVARAAGMSLGAAYYYFPSKEAIVHAYYRAVHERWGRGAAGVLAATTDLGERVRRLYHLHFDAVGKDRPLLVALARRVADPASELAVFANQTADVRDEAIAVWRAALAVPEVPEPLRELGALGLWALNLGLMLYFVWDGSPRQARTRELIDAVVDAIVPLVPLAGLPFAAPAIAELEKLLARAGLRPRAAIPRGK
jgi:AcrR family transcriptional regulator